MNILVIADQESAALWDYFEQSRLKGIDLILSCGDLNPQYLSFLATFFQGPVLYVRGNHDDGYAEHPPEGCICIEDDIYVYKGIRILGLGGSMRYREGKNQYTQAEMYWRIFKMWFKIRRHRGFDILLTHSPAYHLYDEDNLPHTGFKAFIWLLDKYSPRYFVYGHVHLNYNRKGRRLAQYKDTMVVNAFEKYVIEY